MAGTDRSRENTQRSFEMKKNRIFHGVCVANFQSKTRGVLAVMTAILLSFALVLAACSKNDSGGGSSSGGGGNASSRSSGKETPASDFAYDATEDFTGVIIKKYTGNGGKVVVPAKIEGLPVVEIRGSVFAGIDPTGNFTYGSANAEEITELVIPDSVVTIDWNLCRDAQSLTKITLPDGLKEIPDFAFYQCKNLTTVNLPSSLESIGRDAFSGCGELANLTIPDSLGEVTFDTVLGNYTFRGCGKLPLAVRAKIKAWGYTGDF
jgi:hypothetical protein